jgi:ribosomal protein L24
MEKETSSKRHPLDIFNEPKKKLWRLKVGDNVKVISGADKNKRGEVIKVYRKTGKVLVKGINFKFKHIKPNTESDVGEIKQFEAPIHHSNVKKLIRLLGRGETE